MKPVSPRSLSTGPDPKGYPPHMAEAPPSPTVLLPEAEVARVVADLAARVAPHVDDETVAVVLLTGGLWFAADLTRALSRLGRNVRFDALWLASYGDETESRGSIDVRAPLQRPVTGRKVLILDEPTEGIQPSVVGEIEAAITALTERGDLGVLLVEQHIGFALESSQRYYILESGRVTSSGSGGSASEADVRAAMAI